MQLSLETFCKTPGEQRSSEIGRSELTVSAASYRKLEALEDKLRESDQQELFADVDDTAIEVETPAAVDGLKECKVRLYVDREEQAAHFHVIGRQAGDNSLIYTNPVLVRTLVV
jgi:hypothetical protein